MMNVRESYLEKEKAVVRMFSSSELKEHFTFKPDDNWKTSAGYTPFDIVIYKKEIPYAVIEVKSGLADRRIMAAAKNTLEKARRYTGCRFGIITDSREFYIRDYADSGAQDFRMAGFDDIVSRLMSPEDVSVAVSARSIVDILDENGLGDYSRNIHFSNDLEKYVLDTAAEQSFFMEVLGTGAGMLRIYRYIPLDIFLLMLNNLTYRICGIAGMNDKSEVDYFDSRYKFLYEEKAVSQKEVNQIFLSSFSELEDDLTMWRLYGDDGRGVCLEFEVKSADGFYFAHVSYADNAAEHKLVRMIKELLRAGLYFCNLNIWKHFFKPVEYNVEKEIRLVYLEHSADGGLCAASKSWFCTKDNSIIIPALDFNLNDAGFPLSLKSIILGPKLPESDTNKVQIEEMLFQKKIDATVRVSSIRHYR